MIPYNDELESQVAQVVAISQDLEINAKDLKTSELLNQWATNKEFLYNRFGEKLILSLGDYRMDLPEEDKNKMIEGFNANMFHLYGHAFDDLADFIYYERAGFFDNKVTTNYEYKDSIIKSGMKLLKAFKYFISDEKMLDEIQTAASMIIQNDSMHGELCVSIHPLDFLSSSENTLNWRSCHSLDGAYRGGNLSYMVDSCTFICYIKSDKDAILPRFPTSIPWNNKKWRMLVHTNEQFNPFFAGRQYPFDMGYRIIEYIRECIIPSYSYSLFSEPPIGSTVALGNDYSGHGYYGLNQRYYYLNRELVPQNEIIFNGDGALNFNDLLNSTVYTPRYTFNCMATTRNSWKKIVVGGAPKCPCCGKKDVTCNDSLICDDCLDDYGSSADYFRCEECGSRGHIDDSYWIDGSGIRVCSTCFDNYYGVCDSCGEAYHMDDLKEDENGYWICINCREED